MTPSVDEAVSDVTRVIGIDAYVMYPDSKRFIPDAVLWGFASACILEFVKGFVDFKTLGEAARAKLDGLIAAWKAKQDFEHKVNVDALEPAIQLALAAIPPALPSPQQDAATRRLSDALVELGIKPAAAQSHAAKVAELLLRRPQ